MWLLSFVHVCNCRYGCMYVFAELLLVYVDIIVMSSAYDEVTCSGAGDCGMSDMYMLKSVRERMSILIWHCVNGCFLNGVYALHPLM